MTSGGVSSGIFDIPEVSLAKWVVPKLLALRAPWESNDFSNQELRHRQTCVKEKLIYKQYSREALTTYINPINKFKSHTSVPLTCQQKIFNMVRSLSTNYDFHNQW